MTARTRQRIGRTTYRATLILLGILAGLLLQRVLRPEGPLGLPRAGLASGSPQPATLEEPPGGELGMSFEDPVASLAFLSSRIEQARSDTARDARRAEAARREAVRVARRFDYGAPSPNAPAGYTNLELGLTQEDSDQDARTSALALSPSTGVRAPYGGPTHDVRASTSSTPAPPTTARATGVRGARRVPRPPVRGAPRVIADARSTPRAATGGSVTIGEPIQDLPPSTAMLARAAKPFGASTPSSPAARPSTRVVPPPPPPVEEEGYDQNGDSDTLIGPERAPALEPLALVARGAVLLRPGRLRVEPSLTYTYSDRARITTRGLDLLHSIFIGEIFNGDVQSSQLTSSVSLRYGFSDRINLRATIPYQYRKTEVFSNNLDETGVKRPHTKETHQNLGDVTLGVSYQIYRSDSRLPSIVGNFSYSMDTGDPPAIGRGADRISTGLTFVTQSDPAALFASINYFHTLDDFQGFQRGDMLGGSVGFSYALNYDLSLSTSFNFLREIESSTLEGAIDVTRSQLKRRTTIGTLGLGITYGLTNRMALDINIITGLTDDAPEFSLFVGFPMVFDTSGWW